MKEEKNYYTYILRCQDNTLYTGITTDLERRMKEHREQKDKCAKYTLTHPFKKLEVAWQSKNRVLASKLEYQIKQLTKKQKDYIIQEKEGIKELLFHKLEVEEYHRIEP